ncbi:iron complex outermembrane receptor protein [Sphingomonas jejuensis]|uniref:Iron complex outermembrane receptor protein n=1 Tax=Sphingomonas jejuensis TaxID=904715 RepID=A0ABX0XMT7_9SPHN|nr:TonB-dependent receptor [Sphingomonas jejuensis]NJC34676.1 iron complex outermembrane receptor protein [Sphingomonas jejuensis]
MRHQLFAGAALFALTISTAAHAQSTGSIDFEETTEGEEIIVTGTRTQGVEGIEIPDSPKARVILNQEYLERQAPGQTVLDALNLVPGVNFTQSDPFGSSGGNIRIRGFDGNRISLTFDGFPLNDTGNYAIYSNQQLDPELIDEINVNLGTTDIDSPTASAAGGTINYRTIIPSETLSATAVAGVGDFDYVRAFGLIETGNLNSSGTRAFLSASRTRNDKFKGPGEIDKWQANVGIYQPIGSNGDFFRVSGHYNENRNNFYRNLTVNDLRSLLGSTVIPATAGATSDNPIRIGDFSNSQYDLIRRFENLGQCNLTVPGPGVQNANGGSGPNGTGPTLAGGTQNPLNAAACTNYYNLRVNPSNTGNVRANLRLTLSDQLTFTADAGYQYTLAHGGGTTTLAESSARARGGTPTAPGVDYNGDGDFLDTVRFFTPNITNTNRYTATASLIYEFTQSQRVRLAYTFDYGDHRQTGEWGYLQPNGNPENIFSGRNGRPVLTADGFQFQQRDRQSYASLHQISGQYIGRFFDDALTVDIGVRVPFFHRELNQNCYTEARGSSGFAYCTSEPVSTLRIIGPNDPVPSTGATPYYAPFEQDYDYDAVLPNIGFTFAVTDAASIFGSYAKGFSAPRTDNLYRSPFVGVQPEKTDAFDLGLRYNNSFIQSQVSAWYINYQNRIITSFDNDPLSPTFGTSLDRNVGEVESYGVDATVTVRPTDWVALTAIGSYLSSEFKDDVPLTGTTNAGIIGKRVPETPEWQFGGRAQFTAGPLDLGVEAKWVDERFGTDVNDVVFDDYTLVDVDLRFNLADYGLEESFIQLNVLNVFNERYFSNISTQINAAGNPNGTYGYPRTFMGSIRFGF